MEGKGQITNEDLLAQGVILAPLASAAALDPAVFSKVTASEAMRE